MGPGQRGHVPTLRQREHWREMKGTGVSGATALSPPWGASGELLAAYKSVTHNLASSLRLPDHSRSQLIGLLSGEHNLLPQ